MTTSERDTKTALFNNDYIFTEEKGHHLLLEQYKIMVNTTENVVARRQRLHTFFFSINSLLIGALGTVAGSEFTNLAVKKGVLIIILSAVGIALCFSWRRLLTSYKQLNSGKFKIIQLLETELPASIFAAEWIALGEGEGPKTYKPFTNTEHYIPIAFFLLYISLILEALVGWSELFSDLEGFICLVTRLE